VSALARDGAGGMGTAQVGLRRGRMGRLARSAAPVDLGTGVGLRSTAEAAITIAQAAVLAASRPAAAGSATLLPVGGNAARVLLAVLAARTADGPAGVVARALAGTCTPVRLVTPR
jgi:hypothetical protein